MGLSKKPWMHSLKKTCVLVTFAPPKALWPLLSSSSRRRTVCCALSMSRTLFLFLFFPYNVFPSGFTVAPYVFLYYHKSCISIFDSLFCIDSFLLSFVSLRNQRLCMVPIKGPAVPVPDDAIMASCVGTASCAALQCTCLGLFGLPYWYIRTPCIVVLPQNCSGLIPV